jgi:hypothetical protein
LINSNVEGVYESKTPIQFKALIELTSIVRPKKDKINPNEQVLGRKYHLGELQPKYIKDVGYPYLPDSTYSLIYLSHVQSSGRQFWMLTIEATKEIQFFVANPVTASRN